MCTKHYSFILIWLLLVNCGSGPVGPEEAFVFPPKIYGSPEWDELSDEEQLKLLQVPPQVLAAMDTGNLIEQYIATAEVYQNEGKIHKAWSGYRQSEFDLLWRDFRVLHELLLRNDLFDVLFELYAQSGEELLNFNEDDDWIEYQPHFRNLADLEVLAAQDTLINFMVQGDIVRLFKVGLIIQEKKWELNHFGGG